MKYQPEALDQIIAASKRKPKDQRLFLVRDIHNTFDENAVMLHNGEQKLGHVSATQSKMIRQILDELIVQEGTDQAIVVKISPIKNESVFTWSTSILVHPVGHVYERVTRKFAQGD